MFRVASVLLTIVLILACPFHCMASVGGTVAPSDETPACPCCSHESPGEVPASEQDPLAPDENCACGSCLCHGAVVDPDTAPADLEVAGLNLLAVILPPQSGALDFAIDVRPDWLSDFAASPPAGRAARILHQSFLF